MCGALVPDLGLCVFGLAPSLIGHNLLRAAYLVGDLGVATYSGANFSTITCTIRIYLVFGPPNRTLSQIIWDREASVIEVETPDRQFIPDRLSIYYLLLFVLRRLY